MSELSALHVDETQLAALLPSHVPLARFKAVLIAAAKQTPAILTALPVTVNQAVTQAAEDGLLPDGREGVINIYNEKRKIDGVEKWVPCAKWMPMAHGYRKRAMELGGIIIDAQIVRAGDHFLWRGGDDAKIEHEPAGLDKDPGAIIGAYAIFRKQLDGGQIITLHREVMRMAQLEAVKACSKMPGGLLWTKFLDEAYRKTVVRRGIKTVPAVHPDLMRLVSREDDTFSFDRPVNAAIGPAVMPPSITAPVAPPMPPSITAQPQAAMPMMPPSISEPVPVAVQASPEVDPAPPERELSKSEQFLGTLDKLLADVEPGNLPRLEQVWNRNENTIERKLDPDAKAKAFSLWDRHHERVAPSKEAAQ